MRDETARPPTLSDLWAEACRLADSLPAVFGEPAAIAGAGLSRRLALRCCNWLWAIEALIRRLIIAAALAFDPEKLAPLRRRASPSEAEAEHALSRLWSRPPRFRLFAFASPPANPPDRPPSNRRSHASRPYGHVPFPADDLLRLGHRPLIAMETSDRAAPDRAASSEAPAVSRQSNPLVRRGRISRWDPDYCGRQDDLPARLREAARSGRTRRPADPVSSLHRLPASTEWRRVEEEWERVLPAPHLAHRISALLRVIEKPKRWVVRLARRLQKSNLAAGLAARKPPRLRRPRLDRTPPFDIGPLILQAHGLWRLDTS